MPTESVLQASEHHLQLFDSSESLAGTVARFVVKGLEQGQNVLVVATSSHLELIAKRMDEIGWNLHEAVVANRAIVADANQSLEKLMRYDRPNPVAFDEIVGTLVQRLSAGKRPLIYGEMVDVLAERGNYKGAQKLEELWNALAKRERFTLLCGYSSAHFGNLRTAGILGAICAAHDHVHRNSDDMLAEFLLEHPDVKAAAAPE